MTTKATLEEVAALPAELNPREQAELAHKLIELLSESEPAAPEKRFDWRDLIGLAPNLLDGEDAQEWVSRTRHEDTATGERIT